MYRGETDFSQHFVSERRAHDKPAVREPDAYSKLFLKPTEMVLMSSGLQHSVPIL